MNLQEYMRREGLTDAQMADRVSIVKRSYITLLRLKQRSPSLNVALRIEQVTNGAVPATAWSESPPTESAA